MNFTSVNFYLFFIVVFVIYWALRNSLKWQNIYLLIINYVLYYLWDFKFLSLLLLSSIFSYFIALNINKTKDIRRKIICYVSVFINLGILFIFKYYDFFISEFVSLFSLNPDSFTLKLLLPIGISFYTFTTLGYILDVYFKKREPIKQIIPYLTFISFFPLILSGPIERSTTLLPQICNKRTFTNTLTSEGILQVFWGLFKKIVIADNCAMVVNHVINNSEHIPASSLLIGAILYSMQIYFDFSGYSDIAIGLSKLLGFNVRRNFNYPYFALNVTDFWRRWHMSLQRWFIDYIYIPLGGNRCSNQKTIYNTFIVFLICGIWHGANWTFVVWGIYHALLFIPFLTFLKNNKKITINDNKTFPSVRELFSMLVTFSFITIGWIIFNSPSISFAFKYIVNIFSLSIFESPIGIGLGDFKYVGILLIICLIAEWIGRRYEFPLLFKSPIYVKVLLIYILIAHIMFCNSTQSDFIYLQF